MILAVADGGGDVVRHAHGCCAIQGLLGATTSETPANLFSRRRPCLLRLVACP